MNKQIINDNIFIIHDFLTPQECDFHIKASETIGYQLAKVNMNGKQTIMTSVRNNQRVLMFDEEMAAEIWEKLAPFVDEYPVAKPIGLNEMWRYYKYVPGERFKLHKDGSHRRSETEQSLFTLLIYLNDDFEGGATGFNREFDVQPKKGTAIVFNHDIKHEGKPIMDGIKYVLRTDIMFQINV